MQRVSDRTTGGMGPFASVRAAVALLTRIPVGVVASDPGAGAFAAVGAAVGLLGAVPLVLFGLAGEPVLGAIASVAAIAIVSGGLHLDGLADTADALLAPSPAAAERARQEPALGPGGAAAILIVLGSQVAALASVGESSGPWAAGTIVVVAGSVSRWLPVVAVVLLRRRVGPDGLGAWFGAHVATGDAVVGAATVAVVTAATAAGVVAAGLAEAPGGWAVGIAAAVGLVAGLAVTILVVRTRGRLDGDGLGACVEIGFSATVVGLALIVR